MIYEYYIYTVIFKTLDRGSLKIIRIGTKLTVFGDALMTHIGKSLRKKTYSETVLRYPSRRSTVPVPTFID
jgi:hypothetical protein